LLNTTLAVPVFVIVKVIVFWVPTVTLWKFALEGLKDSVPCVAAAARLLRTAERIVELNKAAQRIPRKKRNACLETRGPGPYFCIPVAGYGGAPLLTTGRKHSNRPASFVCLGTRLRLGNPPVQRDRSHLFLCVAKRGIRGGRSIFLAGGPFSSARVYRVAPDAILWAHYDYAESHCSERDCPSCGFANSTNSSLRSEPARMAREKEYG
jgi:hypothetical protein